MLPYFTLLTLLVFFAGGSRLISDSLSMQRVSMTIVSVLLILFEGLRSVGVGTDSGTYVLIFNNVTSFDDIWWTTEIGYSTLNVIMSLSFDSYNALFLAVSVIVVGFYAVGIMKMTPNHGLALFLFVTLGFYTFSFNGARQGIAASMCFFALYYLLQRRALPYFSMIAFAALFHHTAIIAAPLYFLARKEFKWHHFAYVLIGTAVMVSGLSTIVQLSTTFITDAYATYAQETQGGGELTVLFLLFQGLALYIFRAKGSPDSRIYNYLLSIYVVGLVPALSSVIASVNPSGFLRLHIYFSHAAILLWPMVLRNMKDVNQRLFILTVLVVVMVVFFYLTTNSFSRLVPYQFGI